MLEYLLNARPHSWFTHRKTRLRSLNPWMFDQIRDSDIENVCHAWLRPECLTISMIRTWTNSATHDDLLNVYGHSWFAMEKVSHSTNPLNVRRRHNSHVEGVSHDPRMFENIHDSPMDTTLNTLLNVQTYYNSHVGANHPDLSISFPFCFSLPLLYLLIYTPTLL